MKKRMFIVVAIFAIACTQNTDQKTKEQLKLSDVKKVTFTSVSDFKIIGSRTLYLKNGDTIDPLDVINMFYDTGKSRLVRKNGKYRLYDSTDSTITYRYFDYEDSYLITKHKGKGCFLIILEFTIGNVRILIDSLEGMSNQNLRKLQTDMINQIDSNNRIF